VELVALENLVALEVPGDLQVLVYEGRQRQWWLTPIGLL
jgi:hypothetical protein